jgi:hypothetical protein
MTGTRSPLPQRQPCEDYSSDWSAVIASLDRLLAALRAWQPTGLPPGPPTAEDIVAVTTLGAARPDFDPDALGSAD